VVVGTIVYTTLRDVEEGEELCICYGVGVGFWDIDVEQNEVGGGWKGVGCWDGWVGRVMIGDIG